MVLYVLKEELKGISFVTLRKHKVCAATNSTVEWRLNPLEMWSFSIRLDLMAFNMHAIPLVPERTDHYE